MADPSSLPGAVLTGAVIAFDLDGTLVDTAPDLIGTLNALLAQEGHDPLPLEDARPFIGRGARWMLRRGFTAAGVTLDEAREAVLFDAFLAHYGAHIADLSRPFPGVITALERLKAAGARLAVCTNKRTGLSTHLLEALDMARHFDAIVGADSVPAMKPDPRHLIAAAEQAGGDIARTILVGDAATDAGAARAAGAGLVLVTFGYTDIPAADLKPDALIDHFDQLVPACERLLDPCPADGGRL